MVNPLWTYDRKKCKSYAGVVGVDEAGRGCLAGPVTAGAVLLPSSFFLDSTNRKACFRVNDSKQLREDQREELYELIIDFGLEKKLFWGVGEASVEEIESENIVGATCLAMERAMKEVSILCDGIWKPHMKNQNDLFDPKVQSKNLWIVSVDGRPMKRLCYKHEAIVKGDATSLAIAMGSLIAKVTRDKKMRRLSEEFPFYDFSSNKGYGAPKHLKALKEYGPTIHHRSRFIRNIFNSKEMKVKKINELQSQLSFF